MPVDPKVVKDLFLAAVELETEQRGPFLDRSCRDNPELRRRVEALLQAHGPDSDSSGNALDPNATTGFTPAPEGAAATEKAGQLIGPYKLLQLLGEGGMGSVWLAEQSEPVRRQVALKIVKAGMDSAQVLARFDAERQALALMDHQNIARVLDAGATPTGRPYFAMELVKGLPFTTYCDRERLSLKQRLELFVPVCQAVQHAHQKGIIHRDLKPSNVIVGLYDGRPVPKVIDFGIAKATDSRLTQRTMFTAVGAIIGTPEYMAPEQAELNNLDIDTRADVYALGVILYELLTGSTPFSRKQLHDAAFTEMLRLIREVDPPKPSTKLSSSEELPGIAAKRHLEPKRLTRQIAGDLDWIVMKCLEKERGRRYATANGLALDLLRYLSDEPVSAGPPSRIYKVRKFVRRNRGSVIAAGLLLLALFGGALGTTWQMLEAQAERDQKVNALQVAVTERNRAAEQEARANDQAEIVKQVNDFLCKDVLLQADSHQQAHAGFPEDPDLTVKKALQRASEHIEARFADNPLVEAGVRTALGNAFVGAGDGKLGIPHLERAVLLRTTHQGADHEDALTARGDLATALKEAGRTADAVRELEEVLAKRQALLGETHLQTLTTQHNLAEALRLAGRIDDAVRIQEAVVSQFESIAGPDDVQTLTSRHNLAVTYSSASRIKEAVQVAEEVLEARQRVLGHDHLNTIITLHALAAAYRNAGRLDDALRMHEQVRDLHWAKLGNDHPRTLIASNMLGWAYQSAGRIQDAIKLFEQTYAIQVAKLGKHHPDTFITGHNLACAYRAIGRTNEAIQLHEQVRDGQLARWPVTHPSVLITLNNLAIAYQNADRLPEAVKIFEQVREVQAAQLGLNHVDTQITMHNVAVAYRTLGRYADAIRIHEQVRDLQIPMLGADHPNVLITLNNLAIAYQAAGRRDEALPIFEQAAKSSTNRLGADHVDTLITRHNVAGAYVAANRAADAVPIFEDVVERFKKTIGAGHPNRLTTLNSLGDAYLKVDRPVDAERVLREGLVERDKNLGDHWSTHYTRSLLGASLSAQSKHADAEPLLLQSFASLKKQQDKMPPVHRNKRLTEAAERLVKLYEAMGRPEETAKWRVELEKFKNQSKP